MMTLIGKRVGEIVIVGQNFPDLLIRPCLGTKLKLDSDSRNDQKTKFVA